jgi:hypothetical protein
MDRVGPVADYGLPNGLPANAVVYDVRSGRRAHRVRSAHSNSRAFFPVITVVSGLPRSGTSLMMQMLVAGGLPVLTDGLRSADENNPKGYFEWEPAKSLKQHPEAIASGEGKVVKIISALLPHLPETHQYRVVFMMRPLEEVVSSQNRMLERLGKEVPRTPAGTVVTAFQKHLREVDGWLSNKPHLSVLRVQHSAVLAQPREESARIAEFLATSLNVDEMARQVERSLYRERAGSMSPTSR